MAKTLRIIPVQGLFASISFGGKNFEIHRQNPHNGQLGTDVNYADAVQLLCIQPPLVALSPEHNKDQVVAEEDAKLIDEANSSGVTIDVAQNKIPNNFGSSTDNEAIQALRDDLYHELHELSATIAAKDKEILTLQGQVKRLQQKSSKED